MTRTGDGMGLKRLIENGSVAIQEFLAAFLINCRQISRLFAQKREQIVNLLRFWILSESQKLPETLWRVYGRIIGGWIKR